MFAVGQLVARIERARYLDLDRKIAVHSLEDARRVEVLAIGLCCSSRDMHRGRRWRACRRRAFDRAIAERIDHVAPAGNLRRGRRGLNTEQPFRLGQITSPFCDFGAARSVDRLATAAKEIFSLGRCPKVMVRHGQEGQVFGMGGAGSEFSSIEWFRAAKAAAY